MVLDILEHVVVKATEGISIRVVLVGTDVDHIGIGEDVVSGSRAVRVGVEVLVKDVLNEPDGLGVLVLEVEVVVLTTARTRAQVRTHLGERQGVSRGVDLGNDVDAEVLGVLDELLKVGLAVPHVGGGQVGLVLTAVAALLDVGLEAEAGVGLHRILKILKTDEVVVQVNLEVVHLVERHLLGDLLEEVKREGLAANVQDETTDLVQRVVAGGADGEAVLARLHALENGLATPVGASDLLGRHDDAVGLGLQQVALVAEALGGIVGQGKEDVTRSGRGAGNGLDARAGNHGVIRRELLGHGLEGLGAVHHALGGRRGELTLAASPLAQLGQHARGSVGTGGHGAGNGDVELLERVVGLVLLVLDLEGGLDRHVGDGTVDLAVRADDLLVVGTVVLDLVAGGKVRGQRVLELGRLSGDRLDLNVVEIVSRLFLGRGRDLVPHLELHAGGAPTDDFSDLDLHIATRDGRIKGDLARGVLVIGGLIDRIPPLRGCGIIPTGLIVGNVDLERLGVIPRVLPHRLDVLERLLLAEVDGKPLRTPRRGLGLGHPAIGLAVLLLAIDSASTVLIVIVLARLGRLLERKVRGLRRLLGCLARDVPDLELRAGHVGVRAHLGDFELHILSGHGRIELDGRNAGGVALHRLVGLTPVVLAVGYVDVEIRSVFRVAFPREFKVVHLLGGPKVDVRPLRRPLLRTPAALLGILVAISQSACRQILMLSACRHGLVQRQVLLSREHRLRGKNHGRST